MEERQYDFARLDPETLQGQVQYPIYLKGRIITEPPVEAVMARPKSVIFEKFLEQAADERWNVETGKFFGQLPMIFFFDKKSYKAFIKNYRNKIDTNRTFTFDDLKIEVK